MSDIGTLVRSSSPGATRTAGSASPVAAIRSSSGCAARQRASAASISPSSISSLAAGAAARRLVRRSSSCSRRWFAARSSWTAAAIRARSCGSPAGSGSRLAPAPPRRLPAKAASAATRSVTRSFMALHPLRLRAQLVVLGEARRAPLPHLDGLVVLAVLVVQVAEEEVGHRVPGRGRTALLLVHQDLELAHRLALLAEEGRPVRERERLLEARIPVVVVQLERAIEGVVGLLAPHARHRPDADVEELLQVGLAELVLQVGVVGRERDLALDLGQHGVDALLLAQLLPDLLERVALDLSGEDPVGDGGTLGVGRGVLAARLRARADLLRHVGRDRLVEVAGRRAARGPARRAGRERAQALGKARLLRLELGQRRAELARGRTRVRAARGAFG